MKQEIINILKSYYGCRDMHLLYFDTAEKLYESYIIEKFHVSNTFDDCINYLIDHLNDYTEKYQYANWFFDKDHNKCIYSEKEENIPIYIKKINDPINTNNMVIVDKSISPDKICIYINSYKPTNNIAALAHEFRHAVTMYINNTSGINDKIYKLFMDEDIEDINPAYIRRIDRCLNLFSKSEEEARLDATIHYLQSENINTTSIPELIKISDEYNLISEMLEYLDDIEYKSNIGIYEYIIYLAYFLKKYGGKYYAKAPLFNIDIHNIENQDISKKIVTNIFNVLSNNYYEYLKKLQDAIYVHIIQK